VHHTAIDAEGYRSLKENQQVEFEISNESKGLRAANVRVVSN
jgi:CspA family cold shock protein